MATDQDSTPADDYGLAAVMRHNATIDNGEFSSFLDAQRGLGIYQHDGSFQDDQSYVQHVPPTPRSVAEPEGMRTRSGRSTGRNDSPFSTTKSRVSKSPASRPKKEKKSKVLEKAKTPKLTAPLSILTKDMTVPVKDMDVWVNRSAEVRRQEAEKRQGYVTRPMNSFMLYRSAYADRTKQWATQNNHQVVSSVAGESWPMEPEEVRNQFNEWARIERANHAAAHPEYKFSPSKASAKKRKGDFSDDEGEGSDLDGDPDGEYRGSGRSTRQRRQRDANEVVYLNSTVGFDSNPYYTQHGYDIPQYAYTSNGRVLPSNVAYDATGLAYNPQTGTYVQTHVAQQHPANYAYMPQQDARVPTPASEHGAQTLGGFGLPGRVSNDNLFSSSRTVTPQNYGQYGQLAYPVYQQYPTYDQPASAAQQRQLYEHQQYLQAASQPQIAIDPGLEAAFASGAIGSESHFDEAIGDIGGDAAFAGMPEYFEESISPNQTLAPGWEPTAADFAGH